MAKVTLVQFIRSSDYAESGYHVGWNVSTFRKTRENWEAYYDGDNEKLLQYHELDLPDYDGDIREAAHEILEGEKKKLMAEYIAAKTLLEEKISNLLALEVGE